jgi:hypothetical protein
LNPDAEAALDNDDPEAGATAFLAKFGAYFVESYSEVGTVSTVWSVELNDSISAKDLQACRVAIQRYFAEHARTVPEVCKYFAHGIQQQFKDNLSKIKSTIYGYAKPGTTDPIVMRDVPVNKIKFYMTPDALQRAPLQTPYGIRPYREFQVDFTSPNAKVKTSWEALRKQPNIEITPTFTSGLQKILGYTFMLRSLAKDPSSGMTKDDVTAALDSFNSLQNKSNLLSNGDISPETRKKINKTRGDLEARIQDAEEKLSNKASLF